MSKGDKEQTVGIKSMQGPVVDQLANLEESHPDYRALRRRRLKKSHRGGV